MRKSTQPISIVQKNAIYYNFTSVIYAVVVVRAIAFTPDGSTMAVGFGGTIPAFVMIHVHVDSICDTVCMLI